MKKNVLFITGYKRLPVHFSTLPKQMIEQFKEQNERSASITPAMLEKKAGKKQRFIAVIKIKRRSHGYIYTLLTKGKEESGTFMILEMMSLRGLMSNCASF